MAEFTLEQQRALALARARQRAAEAIENPPMSSTARVQQGHADARYPVASGSVLPFTRYSDGDVDFDSNAGIAGAVRRAVELPGQAMRGEVEVSDGQGGIPDETIGRALEFGAMASPVNPAIRAGDQVIPGAATTLSRRADLPSVAELRAVADQQYDAFRQTPADYPAPQYRRTVADIARALIERGQNEETAPQTIRTLARAAQGRGSDAVYGPREMQTLRRTLGNLARPRPDNPSDAAAAAFALQGIDRYIQAPSQSPTAAQRTAASLLEQANGNWGAMRRSQEIGGLSRIAEIRAGAIDSGRGSGSQVRRRIGNALTNRRPLRGYSEGEIEALTDVAVGTPMENTVRSIGNFLGGGGGLGQLTATGAGAYAGSAVGGAVGGAVGSAVPVVAGTALRNASNRMTMRGLRRADELIRSRSPLYREAVEQVLPQVPGVDRREAIARAILAQQLSSAETDPLRVRN